MNMVVSLLICLGYIVDYSVDLVAAMLLIYDAVDPELNLFLISIKQVFLVVCIFVAYMVLLKIFMTYQRQMNEAFEKQALREEKARERRPCEKFKSESSRPSMGSLARPRPCTEPKSY